MTFLENFVRLLPRRPGPALAALYWYITRRKLRGRNRLRAASADLPFVYAMWIKHRERNVELERSSEKAIQTWDWLPRFSVIVCAESEQPAESIDRLINPVKRQLYTRWTMVDGRNGALNSLVAAADGDFVVLLRADAELSEGGLFRFAEVLQSRRDAAILYGDHDEIDSDGRRTRPWFKPRWNEEMFLAQNYLSGVTAIEASLARRASQNASNLSELLLAASSQAEGRIVHVPHIVCHAAPRLSAQNEWLDAVRGHLQPLGAKCLPGPFGTVKIEWPLPDDLPLVSIIVPTRDKLELLKPCIESVLRRTSYANFEIVIVDNGSVEPRTLQFFEEIAKDPRVGIISYPGSYNFSAINNFAAGRAGGAYLCLLNNDTEVLEFSWLTEMMRYALRPDIGAVGAKLLYEDGSIQHAGVVVGMGGAAGHAHRFLPAGEPGYFRQAHVTHFVSAVTAACLVLDKQKFLAVGGLDEAELPVAFNDVDLCLKLQTAGWRNVYVPHAVLLHHESKSRGSDQSPQNIERYKRELRVLQARWGTLNYDDPQLNPNLDSATEAFVIRL